MTDAYEPSPQAHQRVPQEEFGSRKLRQMPCAERIRLLDRYARATSRFSDSVGQLKNAASSFEVDAFNSAFEGCETARRRCLDACSQVYDHIREHRCALSVPRMPRG